MNTRTLVATFADYNAARQAGRELENLGIASDAIQIQSNQKTTGAGAPVLAEEHHHSGFAGWWESLFGSDHDEQERSGYEGALAGGSTILSAQVPAEMMDSSVDILNNHGADLDRGAGTGQAATSNLRSGSDAKRTTASNGPIEVVEEELQVGKRAVQRGGVRVYSHVVSQPVEEQVRLSEEHVRVERRPANRDLTSAEVSALKDQTIEVTEMAEEAVVSKRARVREEVVIGKEATERTETVRDTVRHTEVEVEQVGQDASSLRGSATNKGLDQQYAPAGANFDTTLPGYDYGYRSAGDARYHGKSWDQVESDLRSDYQSRNPGSTWESVKDSVRNGWDKVTGR